MENSFTSRLKHAWNAFFNKDPTDYFKNVGTSYTYRPDRPRLTRGNERSIVTSVYNRIALDASSDSIQHVRLDKNNRFLSVIDSGLNNCLTNVYDRAVFVLHNINTRFIGQFCKLLLNIEHV